jgi:hypothetical protein
MGSAAGAARKAQRVCELDGGESKIVKLKHRYFRKGGGIERH